MEQEAEARAPRHESGYTAVGSWEGKSPIVWEKMSARRMVSGADNGIAGDDTADTCGTLRRRRAFAWVWMPDRYLRGRSAPLVLSIGLPWREDSPRWKQVAEPYPGRFMHHLELYDPAEVDDEVCTWLRQAWQAAA